MPAQEVEESRKSHTDPASTGLDRQSYTALARYLPHDTSTRTLVDVVYDRILLQIIRGELPSDTELKSTRIAEEMQVSRTPVVQALARLVADGIVTQQTNYRAIVRAGAENWLVDVHALRQQIEPPAARAAAGQVSKAVLDDLHKLVSDARSRTGEDRRTAARLVDYALHLAIAEFCGNLAIGETIRKCWMYKRVSYDAVADSESAIQSGIDDHDEILQLLSSGDGAAAFEAMQRHLNQAAAYRVHQRIV